MMHYTLAATGRSFFNVQIRLMTCPDLFYKGPQHKSGTELGIIEY